MSIQETALNVRIYSDGRDKDSKQSLLSTVVAIVTLFIYTGWINIFVLMVAFSWVKPIGWIVLALLFTLLLPAKPVLWKAFNQSWVFKTWREYFSFSFCFEEHIDPAGRYVYAEFPHGVFPLGPLVAGTMMQTLFHGFQIYSIAATSLYYIPFYRHFTAWIGALPATKDNFKKLLKKGSVAVIVGGIAEMFMQHPQKERIKLQDRKGFCRIALESGADGVVPVYHFGNTQVMDFGPDWLSKLSRKYRTSVGLMIGRWGLPVPRQKPIYMVTGKCIPVAKVDKSDPDFEKHVDKLHAAVVQALQEMYDRHKASYGWADRPLEIS